MAVEVLDRRAMELRLLALTRAGSDMLPDVVQLELASAAKFLDPATGRVPLLPIDPAATAEDLAVRRTLWERNGISYGLPLDVHPTLLAYRVDLWEQVGVDPADAKTWPEFRRAAERYVAFWRANGHPERRALELSRSSSEHLALMLQQQGVLPQAFEDDRVRGTLAFVARLAAGPDAVARPTSRGHGRWAADFVAGDVGMLWMPDWRVAYLKRAAPSLAGKVALMPLPRFAESDAPTASWGGTMLGVPVGVADPKAAIDLAEFVASSPEVLATRRRGTAILPPRVGQWQTAATDDGYFTNGPAATRYAEVAAAVRSPRVDPTFLAAAGHLAVVLSVTAADLDAGRSDVEQRLRRRLSAAADDVSRYARRSRRLTGTPVATP